eukprot:9055763-Alexandrium_andersonii.AAC.1
MPANAGGHRRPDPDGTRDPSMATATSRAPELRAGTGSPVPARGAASSTFDPSGRAAQLEYLAETAARCQHAPKP